MNTLNLELAGVPLRVTLHDAELDAALARYQPFLTEPRADALHLDSRYDPTQRFEQPSEIAWPGAACVRRDEHVIELGRRRERLTYDRKARRAQLVLGREPAPLTTDRPPHVESALRMLLAMELIEAGGLLLHATGWSDGSRAVLFPAFSGGGKTTTARKLPGTTVLSDDQVALKRAPSGWEAFSLPFVGEWAKHPAPLRAPLSAIALLGKSESSSMIRLSPARGLARLLSCVVSFDSDQAQQAVALAEELISKTPAYDLKLTRDEPLEPWLNALLTPAP